jgi:hypothetical protein
VYYKSFFNVYADIIFLFKGKIIFLILFLATTAAAAQETLAQSIVRNREFFVKLNGYEDWMLSEIEVLERGKLLGIVVLSPEGFEQHFVFEVATMLPVYANARILGKDAREFLADTSIKMSEVKKLAEAATTRAAELQRGWALHEGKPGNIVPKNTSAEKTEPKLNPLIDTESAPASPVHENRKKGHISNVSNEIKQEVASISTKEILERFRAEVREFSTNDRVG